MKTNKKINKKPAVICKRMPFIKRKSTVLICKRTHNFQTLICLHLLLQIFLFSCQFDKKPVKITEAVSGIPNWTFLVYMAADNDLYKSAENDINEILNAQFSEQSMQILVFLDSSNPIKIQQKEYSGSNFFCVKNARNGTNFLSEISLENLDFSNENVEIVDSGDICTLEKLLAYTKSEFPAKNQALFMWGHGTGYKYAQNQIELNSETVQTKGICQDFNSGSYISTIELENALKSADISLIGFDACFSGLLEVSYQLKSSVKTIVGSEGALNVSGWDYEKLFTQFSSSNQSHQSLAKALYEQYASQYSTNDLLILDTSKIEQIASDFNDFTKAIAYYIDSTETQNQVFDLIFSSVKSFVAPTFPTEMFIDIFDFAKVFSAAMLNSEVTEAAQKLIKTLTVEQALGEPSEPPNKQIHIAAYIIALESKTAKIPYFDNIYINDSKNAEKLEFTKYCDGWVPTRSFQTVYDSTIQESLLDKLFFTIF